MEAQNYSATNSSALQGNFGMEAENYRVVQLNLTSEIAIFYVV